MIPQHKLMQISQLIPHPLSETLFGEMSDEEYDDFKMDIKVRGVRNPLHVDKMNRVICGSQRLRALKELDIEEIEVIVWDDLDGEAIDEHLIQDNLKRRHLTPGQIYKCGKALEEIYFRNPTGTGVRTRVAESLDLSETTYWRIKTVMESGDKKLAKRLADGEVAPGTALKHLRLRERPLDSKQHDLFVFLKLKKRVQDIVKFYATVIVSGTYESDMRQCLKESIRDIQGSLAKLE